MADAQIIKQPGKNEIIVNQLNIISVNRVNKDIADWRNAHINAESIQYPNRTRLYDVYKDIELDGHLSGIVQKRFDAVLNKNLFFETQEGKVEEMDDLIGSNAFRNLIQLILEQRLWGVSGAEFLPGKEFKFLSIPRKHIKPKWGIIAVDQNDKTGWKYDDIWNLFVIGDNDNLGLYLKCAPYAIWKKGGFADWGQYVEIFGQPMRIFKYDAYDLKTKEELYKVANESGSSLAMLVPKQAEIEMQDGKTSNGTGELQERFKNACNQEMSIIILGNTETTSASSSSGYAQSKEHGKQQDEIIKSDLKFVENMLNSEKLINILKSYGYPVEGGHFLFENSIDLEELNNRKNIDITIAGKVPIADDYWYETYGIPKPDNYDELKEQMEAERIMKIMSPDNEPADPAPGTPKPKSLPKQNSLSAWEKFRQQLADFFDPAP